VRPCCSLATAAAAAVAIVVWRTARNAGLGADQESLTSTRANDD
jgi:hypothetical protein